MTSATEIFQKIPKVQDMLRKDRAKTLREQLKAKFRTVPKWADEMLESATAVQLQRWSRKFATANTLEDVLGKE